MKAQSSNIKAQGKLKSQNLKTGTSDRNHFYFDFVFLSMFDL
jgi:hypothetical protein